MVHVAEFTFNPFQENTFLVYDDTKECIIFDPGCYEGYEKEELLQFIILNELKPVRLINTHCHIDHIFGNKFISDTYGLPLEIHKGELPVLNFAPQSTLYFGISYPEPSPQPGRFIEAGDVISFGNSELKALFTPGHSPASLSFYCESEKFVIAGDVLFQGSIGRTDLPGGDFATLIRSIQEQLFTLDDAVKVYPGHGSATTIGQERRSNPFLT